MVRRARFILLLALISAAGASSRADPASQPASAPAVSVPHFSGTDKIIVPLQRVKRTLLTVDVRIEGQKVGPFLINTGSPLSLIDTAVADRLHLPTVGNPPARAGGITVREIRSISLGNTALENHVITAIDLSDAAGELLAPVAGVIGGDFLSHFPCTVDYRDLTLTLYSPEKFQPPEGAVRFPLAPVGRADLPGDYAIANTDAWIPSVNAEINGIATSILLDTGSNLSVTLYPPFTQAHADAVNRLAGHIRPMQSASDGGELYPAKIRAVSLLGQTFRDPWSAVAIVKPDRAVANVAPRTNETTAGAGALLLERFRLTFDYRHHRVWAEPSVPLTMAEQLARGLKPNTPDPSGRTPLMEAASVADAGGCRELIKAGADPTVDDAHGVSPLHIAAEAGSGEIIKLFLAVGSTASHVDAKDARGITPLMRAATAADPSATIVLLDAGADPAQMARDGRSALHFAAAHGNGQAIRALVGRRADVNLPDRDGFTPLERLITDSGSPEAYDLLVAAGARLSPAGQRMSILHIAAGAGAAQLIEHVLADPAIAADLAKPDRAGDTPLTLAARGGHTAAAAVLLEAGADPNQQNKAGIGALHYAAEFAKVDLLKVLLSHHADVNLKTAQGGTALMIASLHGRSEVLSALLDAGADAKTTDPDGGTALHAAVVGGHPEAIRLLVAHGAQVNLKNNSGYSPVDIAKKLNNADVLAAMQSDR